MIPNAYIKGSDNGIASGIDFGIRDLITPALNTANAPINVTMIMKQNIPDQPNDVATKPIIGPSRNVPILPNPENIRSYIKLANEKGKYIIN